MHPSKRDPRQKLTLGASELRDAFRIDSGNWLSPNGLLILAQSGWHTWQMKRDIMAMSIQYPTEKQIHLLDQMLYNALVEIQELARQGRLDQVADLADAFHNLPVVMHSDHFSFAEFRRYLANYHRKYPVSEGHCLYNYLELFQKVLASEDF